MREKVPESPGAQSASPRLATNGCRQHGSFCADSAHAEPAGVERNIACNVEPGSTEQLRVVGQTSGRGWAVRSMRDRDFTSSTVADDGRATKSNERERGTLNAAIFRFSRGNRARGAAVGALLVTAIFVSACGGGSGSSRASAAIGTGDNGACSSSASGSSPQRGGTLTFARFQDPTTLVPNNGITDNPTIQTELQIYDQLLELQPCQNKPGPGLAETWSTSKDGLTWTFHLRHARFSNGRPVTSADVVFSLDRVLNPKIDPGFGDTFNLFTKSVTASGPYTVVFQLKHPYAGLPYWLVFNIPSIVSKVDFERMGAKAYASHPIGSGPFMLQSWQRGSELTLVRNPYYWRKGLPYLNKVIFKIIPSDNTRVLEVQSGQVDMADDLPFTQLAPLKSNPNLSVLTGPGPVFQVFFDEAKRPLNELAVRQALNYATPAAQINQVVFKGFGQLANSITPRLTNWSPAVKRYPYDIAKAKAALAKSTVPHGFPIQLEIVGTDEPSVLTGQIMQQAWAKVGVHLQIHETDQATAFNDVTSGNYQAILMPPSVWSSDIPAEDEFLLNLATSIGQTWLGYRNPQLQALVKRLTDEDSQTLRTQLIHQGQAILINDAVAVPTVYSPVRVAFQKNVHGFAYTPTNSFALDSVWLAH
jgi:peptide/nickel transport system substrate-binding protein